MKSSERAAKPTIYDVAAAAGVSKSLVSLVLQRDPRVSDASRRAVEEAISELGYRPSRAASALAAHRTKSVGLLIDDYTNLWFVDLARGLHEVLAESGYRLSVADIATASAAEDPVEGMLSSRVDGIVVAMDVPDSLLGPMAPPVVIVGTRDRRSTAGRSGTVDSVANDDRLGARLAMQHLLALGHRRIAHLPAGGGAGLARAESARQYAEQAGIPLVMAPLSPMATEAEAYRATLVVLREHPELTAVFAANDTMAIGALGAARDCGRPVPGSLSVVGYDNSELAGARLIDLTTVDDVSSVVGREAGRLLLARMSGATTRPVHRTLEPALVVRGTTGEAPLRAS